MNPKNLAITFLLALLLILSLGCADTPTEPELTEEDVARIVDQKLAEMIGAEAGYSPKAPNNVML